MDGLTLDATVARVELLLERGGSHRHCCVSAAKLNRMYTDPALREAVLTSDLISADGAGVLWAARVLGLAVPPRVTGISLFLRLVAQAAQTDRSIFLLGDTEAVVGAVRNKLQHAWPTLRIVGAHQGYLEDEAQVAGLIALAQPDLLFVAMGTPRQEHFQHRFQAQMQVPFSMGVGGSFSVVANRAWRAPPIFGDAGLEWLYRLAQDPTRLWRRNLVEHGGFLARVAAERLALRRS